MSLSVEGLSFLEEYKNDKADIERDLETILQGIFEALIAAYHIAESSEAKFEVDVKWYGDHFKVDLPANFIARAQFVTLPRYIAGQIARYVNADESSRRPGDEGAGLSNVTDVYNMNIEIGSRVCIDAPVSGHINGMLIARGFKWYCDGSSRDSRNVRRISTAKVYLSNCGVLEESVSDVAAGGAPVVGKDTNRGWVSCRLFHLTRSQHACPTLETSKTHDEVAAVSSMV